MLSLITNYGVALCLKSDMFEEVYDFQCVISDALPKSTVVTRSIFTQTDRQTGRQADDFSNSRGELTGHLTVDS